MQARYAWLLAVCVLLAGCGSAAQSEPPATETATSTPTPAPTPARLDALVTYPSCTAVTIAAPSYDTILVATGDGTTTEFTGDYSGERTFRVNATIQEVLVLDGNRSRSVVNPAAEPCRETSRPTPTPTPTATPTPTPTPTATPEPDYRERINATVEAGISGRILFSIRKDTDDEPYLEVVYTIQYWTDDDPQLRAVAREETIVVQFDEPVTREYWVNTTKEGSIEGTELTIESVEPE